MTSPRPVRACTQARGLLGKDWRVRWHEGLIALASEEVGAARQAFDAVLLVAAG